MKLEITIRNTMPDGNKIDKCLQEQIILTTLQREFGGVIDIIKKEEQMGVKFYCKVCKKEIWKGMDEETKETLTVAEAEELAICSECILADTKK